MAARTVGIAKKNGVRGEREEIRIKEASMRGIHEKFMVGQGSDPWMETALFH